MLQFLFAWGQRWWLWSAFLSLLSTILFFTNNQALVPYLETYYDLSYSIVSLIFLSPALGSLSAALLNHTIHRVWGQRGIALLCAACHLLSYSILSAHPPFPVLVVFYFPAGVSQGLASAAWNARAGAFDHVNEVLGVLHGCYGLGAVVAPLVATSMIAKAGLPWYTFYYVMVGLSALEMGDVWTGVLESHGAVFREETGMSEEVLNPEQNEDPRRQNKRSEDPRRQNERSEDPRRQSERSEDPNEDPNEGSEDPETTPKMKSPLRATLTSSTVWFVAVFFIVYSGIEVALGGWTTTFMLRVRHAAAFPAGMAATGYWLGITCGRIILGFVTARLFGGVRWAVTAYLLATAACHLAAWLVPHAAATATMVALEGFFLGPMFPAGIAAATQILPKRLHVAAIGFTAACGAAGGGVLPFVIGGIAQTRGVAVLQLCILAMLAGCWLLWLRIGMGLKRKGRD